MLPPMFIISVGLFFSFVAFSLFAASYFCLAGRLSAVKHYFSASVNKEVVSFVSNFLFVTLFTFICMVNIIGNIPINMIPSLFYRQTLTLSLLFWFPLVLCLSFRQIKAFFSHLLPYGRPVALSLVLPVIEGFSQLIRPFTLIIRLRTNISSGHIIVYMFSYFAILSTSIAPSVRFVIAILLLLEFFISILQAYIFTSLLILYVHESDLAL